MGEMANLYIAQEMDAFGWNPHGQARYSSKPKNKFCNTCNRCGTTRLKWRTNSAGKWQLYENERVEHNRLKEHVCAQDIPTTEGFDDVE